MGNNSSKIDFCINVKRARQEFHECNYSASHRLFVDAFESNSEAWWLAMEAIRSIRAQQNVPENEHNASGHLFFSPHYTGNSYQSNLYSGARRYGYLVEPADNLELDSLPKRFDFTKNNVYHQHWIKDYYWHAKSFDEGVKEVQRRISILKSFKAFGIKIVWTLHNLVDHDVSNLQAELCMYTHREMARISDIIYVHTLNSINQLSEQCGLDLSNKCCLLEHHIYDNFLMLDNLTQPKEVDSKELNGKTLLVCLGMLRPYKGVPNLLKAFEQYNQSNPSHQLYLIVAGKILDDRVSSVLNTLDDSTKSKVLLIDRRLSDSEMGWLIKFAHASVTPYQKILISGNFYLSTTYGKPTIAPKLGMFPEVINDGETGFLYDGSFDDLVRVLQRVGELEKQVLEKIGQACFNAHKHLTIASTSEKLFTSLGRFW